jgi:hypothetical protein
MARCKSAVAGRNGPTGSPAKAAGKTIREIGSFSATAMVPADRAMRHLTSVRLYP